MLEGSEDAIVEHKSVFLDKSLSMKARGGRKRLSRSEIWDGSPKMLSSSASSPPPTSPQVGAHPPPTPSEVVVSTSYAEMDAAYFHSYAHVGIHEEMIKDRVRTEAYRDAIFQQADFIKDKVVVDVGCGTGILSIFCARAGARKVYAVDASDIAVQAREVVKSNGLSDIVTVLHGKIEDVQIDEEVDVIVSEWMGYMLLYESMLASVIYARDKWLKPGGIILPSHATLYIAPVTNVERYAESIDFWRDVYGIDMSAMLPLAKQCSFEEPSVETITAENVLSWPVEVKHIDSSTVTVQELESVTSSFSMPSMMTASLHGFALWFDVTFGGAMPYTNETQMESTIDCNTSDGFHANGVQHKRKREKPLDQIVLSTSPEDTPTHWQQTVLYIYDPVEVRQDQLISGSITLSQSRENPRFLNIHLEYSCGGRCCVKETVMR